MIHVHALVVNTHNWKKVKCEAKLTKIAGDIWSTSSDTHQVVQMQDTST